jgi:hypothetical protein
VGGRDEVEVGWAVVPERWGQGIGTAIARESAKEAFAVTGMVALLAGDPIGDLGPRARARQRRAHPRVAEQALEMVEVPGRERLGDQAESHAATVTPPTARS